MCFLLSKASKSNNNKRPSQSNDPVGSSPPHKKAKEEVLKECLSCKSMKARDAFSKTQWKKQDRKCKECIKETCNKPVGKKKGKDEACRQCTTCKCLKPERKFSLGCQSWNAGVEKKK